MATPLYPVSAPVQGISAGLFPSAVSKKFFREWIQLFPLWNFMGVEDTRPIVRHRMRAGEGWRYTVAKLNALDYTKPVLNFDQVSGSGQTGSFDEDSVICRKLSFLRELKGKDLIQLGTPIDMPSVIRPQLMEVCQRNLNKCILDSAMYDYRAPTSDLGGYNPNTQLASYDRVALAGKNNGGTATQDGADRTAYYAKGNLKTAWNSLGTATYQTSGLSAKHLFRLKAIATGGGYAGGANFVNGDIEDRIRPAYMKSMRGGQLNDYIYFCTTESIQSLLEDPMFFQSTVGRGTVVSPDQPEIISGSTYHGKFNGIHIYEMEELSRYISFSADGTKRVAWELFVGAAAWSAGWYTEPYIAFKEDVINTVQEFATHEIRGEKALRFKAKQAQTVAAGVLTVEQGIIHSFVSV